MDYPVTHVIQMKHCKIVSVHISHIHVAFSLRLFMYTAGPEDFPQLISVTNISESALLIKWNPPLVPNGVIIEYNIYITYDNGSTDAINVNGSHKEYVLDNLSPHQMVYVNMSASTIAGEGPLSGTVYNRTSQAGAQSEIINVTGSNI